MIYLFFIIRIYFLYFVSNKHPHVKEHWPVIFKDLLDPTKPGCRHRDLLNTGYTGINHGRKFCFFCYDYGSILEPIDVDHVNHVMANFKHYFLYPFSTGNYEKDHLATSIINRSYKNAVWVGEKSLNSTNRHFLNRTVWLMAMVALTGSREHPPTIKKGLGLVCDYQAWFFDRLCDNIKKIYHYFLNEWRNKYLPADVPKCDICPKGINVLKDWGAPSWSMTSQGPQSSVP